MRRWKVFSRPKKVEEVYHASYETHEQTVRAATDSIQRFYNPVRLHLAIGYVSPNNNEQRKLYEKKGPWKSAFVGAIRRSLT